MPYFKHSLGKTFYRSQGRKSGLAPLIFLHGGPGGTSEHTDAIFGLSSQRKVYIYDQIGGGKSSPIPKNKGTIATFVNELDQLVRHWGLKEFHLSGGSWGTTLALEYYLRKKGKGVKSLIFQSPMFSARDWEDDANRLIAKLPAKTRKIIEYCHEIEATDAKVYQEAIVSYYTKHVLRNKKMLMEFIRKGAISNKHGQEIYSHMWGPSEFKPTGTLKTYSRGGDLSKIKVPTLFVCGEFDEATPQTAIKYKKKISGAQVKVIKGGSHALLLEKPRATLKAFGDFLKTVD